MSAANSLIESSKIRNLFAEMNEYDAALVNFNNFLPGDMDNVSDYWG